MLLSFIIIILFILIAVDTVLRHYDVSKRMGQLRVEIEKLKKEKEGEKWEGKRMGKYLRQYYHIIIQFINIFWLLL